MSDDIGCDHCCLIPPGPGPECMCECHDEKESSKITNPIIAVARAINQIPLESIRSYIETLPSEEDICKTCAEPIRTTPAIHKDGSVHWASGGWEHIQTEKSGCDWDLHPYGFAAPID